MAKKVFDLSAIRSPKDLKTLSVEDLPLLCKALRDEMIASVSQTGGHLASSLGAVELIVALHYVFNAPLDKIVFDVGHQAYAHKMLTGRLARFKTLRQFHGLSGFPKRAESSYDAFGTAHSSTSISAALGMAVADALAGRDAWHIAVIGDGALTGGMALEALNHAGAYKSGMKLLIILNDNDCSISPSVGAIRQHLAHLVSGKTYTAVRSLSKNLLSNIPTLKHIVKSMEQRTINFVSPPSTLFSAFDIKYYGPVDGHDVKGLVALLENISQVEGPIVLHICTEKGKGYDKAEKDPTLYHGVAPFDAEVGVIKRDAKLTYTDVFSEWICRAGKANDRLYAITPAMREGSGLVAFEKQFPDRYRDVAIAEQHAVTFAAGLAAAGMHPVVALYSTFAQRAYDQILHDVAIQNLPVTFAFDRAGIVGADGETHQGVFDLAYMRSIPNVVIMAPANAQSAVAMLDLSLNLKAPSVVRYPRASANVKSYPEDVTPVTFGRAACIRKTTKKTKTACVFAFGFMVEHLREVCEALDVTLYDMRFIKPVDRETIREAALSHDYLFTAEDSVLEGGAGSAVIEALAQMHIVKPVTQFALPDFFVGAGQTRELLTENGLDPESIKARICEVCERPSLEVLENVSLQDKNTMGVPALARYFARATTEAQVREAFAKAKKLGLDVFVLGGGSNLVIAAKRFETFVLEMGIRGFSRAFEDEKAVYIRAGAGENWHAFVERTVSLGFAGLENLAMIYGTVGGAVVQNIGAYGSEVGAFVHSVTIYDASKNETRELSAGELDFSYRHSVFKDKKDWVVLFATFAFTRDWEPNLSYEGLKKAVGEKPCAREVMDAVMALRQRKLPDPKTTPNAGSFFKNPIVPKAEYARLIEKIPDLVHYDIGGARLKLSAAQLIDKAGLKGVRREGVGTSEKHALVVCNFEAASGQAVEDFARYVSDTVFERFGIRLESEPVIVPAHPFFHEGE